MAERTVEETEMEKYRPDCKYPSCDRLEPDRTLGRDMSLREMDMGRGRLYTR